MGWESAVHWFHQRLAHINAKLMTLHGILFVSAIFADIAITLLGAYWTFQIERRDRPEQTPERFLAFVFPKKVWLHPSAFLDYQLYAIQYFIGFPFSLPMVIGMATITAFVVGGDTPPDPHASILPTLACAALIALAVDFSFYAGHVMQHRVKLFWEFHKVHHSAEVLTPPTLNRTHPLQDLPTIAMMTATFAAVLIVFSRFQPINVEMTIPLGLDLLLWSRILLFYRLRHSHIPMFFPDWAATVFFSPVHHQTHHSSQQRHFDSNYGLNLVIWDRIFGTLVTPEHPSTYRLGLSNHEEQEFNRSALHLYSVPFRNIWRHLTGKAGNEDDTTGERVRSLLAPPGAVSSLGKDQKKSA